MSVHWSKPCLLAAACAAYALPASAQLQFYEPFDYADDFLRTGAAGPQGSSVLGAASNWNTDETYNGDMWVHPQGETVGILIDTRFNMFDGTVANLPTAGGFLGPAGQTDTGGTIADSEFSRNATADIALDPSITNSFQTGNTTWISYVTAWAWDRNAEAPNVTLATDPFPNQSRGDNFGGIGSGGTGFGTGGGPNRNERTWIYPMHYLDGQYNNINGPIPNNSYASDTATDVQDADSVRWEPFTDSGDFGAPSIVVMKLEWNADTNGEDIQTVVRFGEDAVISEAAFDAIVAAQPGLSTANWDPANKPDIDETQLDTLTFGGVKYFIDEIRIAGDFNSALGLALPFVLGDMNGDGALTNGDIAPFVQALTDPAGYASAFPGLDPDLLGDMNGDSALTNGDIAGFVAALTGGGPGVVPEPSTALLLGILGGLGALRRRR